MKRITLLLLLGASVASGQDSGSVVWATGATPATDTGNKVCVLARTLPQDQFQQGVCQAVFVPGSATEIACDADMTGAGTSPGDWFLVVCK